jgi:flagellar basal body-associated protein FliL
MKHTVSLQKVLVIIILSLVAVIALITVVTFAAHRAVPAYGLRHADPVPQTVTSMNFSGNTPHAAYTTLGQLRTITKPVKKDGTGITVVISPWLAYPDNDRAFYEELDQKNRSIRALIIQYFSKYTERELLTKGELTIKAELLTEINSTLILGKISALYFNEYLFLE